MKANRVGTVVDCRRGGKQTESLALSTFIMAGSIPLRSQLSKPKKSHTTTHETSIPSSQNPSGHRNQDVEPSLRPCDTHAAPSRRPCRSARTRGPPALRLKRDRSIRVRILEWERDGHRRREEHPCRPKAREAPEGQHAQLPSQVRVQRHLSLDTAADSLHRDRRHGDQAEIGGQW